MSQPISQVLLSIPKAFQDEIVTESGFKLFLDTSYSKEHHASVTALVAALPANSHPKERKVLSQLKVGDEVAVTYQVVSDVEYKSDRDQFMPALEDNPYMREFVNGKGDMVKVRAYRKRAGLDGIIWAAYLQNNRRELIDGVQGDEETVERWLSQFPFGKTDIYSFCNFIEHDEKEYWKCHADQIYAVKRKGHLVAVGDRVLCKPIEEEVDDRSLIGFVRKVKIKRQDRARVISGGKDKGIKKEDVIHFDPRYCEKYELWGKEYFLINERMVLGKFN